MEKDNELVALRESLRVAAERHSSGAALRDSCDPTPGQSQEDTAAMHDSSTMLPDSLEDTQEEETTLVPGDTSVLSISADNESSPELLEPQSESPEESKGTSSDEMIASSDSEVAHSSWTLLEAVNQEGGQEWPSVLQDFGQVQSWEATSMEQEVSTVQVETSSVTIRETVQVHITQQSSSSTDDVPPSGQIFAQVLAEEIQKRHSELLAELQRLKEAAAESQEKMESLEGERRALTAVKEELHSQSSDLAEELRSTREELDRLSLQNISVVEKHSVELRLLEEQVDILNSSREAKEQKVQALQTDLEVARQALSEQQSQARMLSAQLEDRELLSTELERKLQDMENSMSEKSQTSDVHEDFLSKKDSEILELQLRLSQKEQEMMDLNDSMSVKLAQVEEDKSLVDREVNELKEQMAELRSRDEKAGHEDTSAVVQDELASLQTVKEELEAQLTNAKKKLQVVLVQRKELLKKVADLEEETKKLREKDAVTPEVETRGGPETQEMEAKLSELERALQSKEEAVGALEQKVRQQDQHLAEMNERLSEKAETSQQPDVTSEVSALQSQVASLETECETLQKKLAEAQESRKETIRKAKEKDRHHREQMKQQLKQQEEVYHQLMERFEVQSSEREVLVSKMRELEDKMSTQTDPQHDTQRMGENVQVSEASDWVQEDWVDFAEADSSQPQSREEVRRPAQHSETSSAQMEETLKALAEEMESVRVEKEELERKLRETQTSLSLKEAQLMETTKELEVLRVNEKQIDALSEEISQLREKYRHAEDYTETLKAEIGAANEAASSDSTASVAALQGEVEDFKKFLDNKNQEIMELSQHLSEQKSLLQSMQGTVSQKDQLIASLQEELRAEQERSQRLEAEVPLRQEDDVKVQQLQRKLQAALISRKEALKEKKTLMEQLSSSENLTAELQQRTHSTEEELEKLRADRVKLIDEVDRMLVENQSLGSSCESLKLAMEGILNEKDACAREVAQVKDEAAEASREWEEKVRGMKDEYETLLKSYENVSDEAERVQRVLEAARQERQELAARVMTHEAARHKAESQAEEAQKEVESVKDKMRKFVKTKQQKILELEEERERLREMQDDPSLNREDRTQRDEMDRLQDELGAAKSSLDAAVTERDSFRRQIEQLQEQLVQTRERESAESHHTPLGSAETAEEMVAVQRSDQFTTKTELTPEDQNDASSTQPTQEEEEEADLSEREKVLLGDRMREMQAAVDEERELWQQREAELKAGLASVEQALQESMEKVSLLSSVEKSLQESKERETCLIEEGSKREVQFKDLLRSLEAEKDNLEERLMNQLAQLNGSIAGYQQEAADHREHLGGLQREVERLERERGELEAQAQSEKDRASRLEEDMRQAQRQRAEAEAETGKQRELEQQLRSAQRVKEGSQSRARQLEELLREKQLEVRQLQKDCIQYQEKISELGREAKALQLGNDAHVKRLDEAQLETSRTLEDLKRTEAEWESCKSSLDETQKQLRDALVEKDTLIENAQRREASMKDEAEQTLDSVRFRLGAELKDLELRLEEAYREREKEEDATLEAREMAEGAQRRAQEMQARLDESLARLAAFSRCMSSLQDDRDRVLDEARQWETRFNKTLQGKEAEIREAEARVKVLTEQLQKESALKEELQLTADR